MTATPAGHEPLDLFRLTPFTADVDLTHDGVAGLTPTILASILESVPAAEAFRWQLASVTERTSEYAAQKCNNIIPARLMSLSTEPDSGFIDPWNGRNDIESDNFRYIRNGFYRDSPLYQAGRDLEIFSALLYIQTLFEAGVDVKRSPQKGYSEATSVFDEAASSLEVQDSLHRSEYLRTRLRNLVTNAAAAAPSAEDWEFCLTNLHLSNALDALGKASPSLISWRDDLALNGSRVIVATACLGGDRLRLKAATQAWSTSNEARRLAEQIFAETAPVPSPVDPLVTAPFTLIPGHSPPAAQLNLELASDQFVVMVSPAMYLMFGNAPSSIIGDDFAHEFLHFDMRLDEGFTLSEEIPPMPPQNLTTEDEEDLTALLAASVTLASQGDSEFTSWHLFAVPTVVAIRTPRLPNGLTKLQLRINALRILEEAAPLPNRARNMEEAVHALTPSQPREPKAAIQVILLRQRKS